jgi:hypothetical protein
MKVMATKMDKDLTFKNTGPVYVFVNDQATGGCWTNIKEVRDYAIGLIEIKGGKIAETRDDAMVVGVFLDILVNAMRIPDLNACVAHVAIYLKTPAWAIHNADLYGELVLSRHDFVGFQSGNLNITILEQVQKALQEW